jgi:hypothetical protein
MIHRSRALVLALVLASTGPVLARHDVWDADPVNQRYGQVGQCRAQNTIRVTRGTVVGPYSGNVVYGGNSISFPVNSGVQYYDARTGGRYVGPGQYTVPIGQQPYGGVGVYNNAIQGYGAYNQQIQYHQYNGNPYVGVNPWNGYAGNTYNGYTYTGQPYNNGFNNGINNNCNNQRNFRSGNSGSNWMWNRR